MERHTQMLGLFQASVVCRCCYCCPLGNNHDLVRFLERKDNPQLFITGVPGSFPTIFVDRGLEGEHKLVRWRHQLEEFGAHIDLNLLDALCT